jgi:N-acetylglucosamine-6-phosphate deacetylase
MTSPPDVAVGILEAVAELTRRGVVLGAHLEGPFLNPVRAGAHEPAWLREPDPRLLDRLLEAGDGSVRVVTLAPELPGALGLVRRLTDAGVVAAAGHSDVDHDGALAAFDGGVSLVTHLFNAMRPWHQREPGLAGATLTRPGITAELIADGVHLHDATLRVVAAAARKRLVLTTDAVADEGRATLADGTLAGSLGTLADAVRRLVSLGVPLPDAGAPLADGATPPQPVVSTPTRSATAIVDGARTTRPRRRRIRRLTPRRRRPQS